MDIQKIGLDKDIYFKTEITSMKQDSFFKKEQAYFFGM